MTKQVTLATHDSLDETAGSKEMGRFTSNDVIWSKLWAIASQKVALK